jgi:CheY-like chemotaxis protein
MVSRAEFEAQITDAYEHLYDFAYLQTLALAELAATTPDLPGKEKGWRLHHVLTRVIDDLDPGPRAPAFSHEWRRHRLMVLRYQDGHPPQAVADELSISRRHFYREHQAALKAVADLLWARYSLAAPGPAPAPQPPSPDRLELLRLEEARIAQARRYTPMQDVVAGVVSVLSDMLRQRQLDVQLDLPDALGDMQIDRGLLRQVLLGMLGLMIEHSQRATLELRARAESLAVLLSMTAAPPTALRAWPEPMVQERLAALEEMAKLGGLHIETVRAENRIAGFALSMPVHAQRTVLVVDDNADVLELFRRYLSAHDYQARTAQTAQAALAQARQLRPYAITLDLMMPDEDGWDVLQKLLNEPDTRHIPVIVCSVLKQKELALSLGATAFLEKPVTEQSLLAALDALEHTTLI